MPHAHLTANVQQAIRDERAARNYERVEHLVAAASSILAAKLTLGEIGMERFSSEIRAILAAAGW